MRLSDRIVERLRDAHLDSVFEERFEVEREAGAGGMGRVYQAIDRETGARVALKVLARDSEVDRARFASEAELLEDLRHPGIVEYVAHGTTGEGEHYIAMEWLEGESLSARLDRGTLSVEDTVKLGRRVAGALAAAHARGIVHRDLKPSNLFLINGEVENVRLVDFGIARRMGADEHLTRTGQIIGTPGYMAPEQARGRRDLDGRTDLFALGCVLFRCLAGRPVFGGEEVLEVLSQLVLTNAPRLSEVVIGAPKELELLIAKLLQREPKMRPASADEVETKLGELESALARGEELAPASVARHVDEFAQTVALPAVSDEIIKPATDDARSAPVSFGLPGSTGVSRVAPRKRRRALYATGGLIALGTLGLLWNAQRAPPLPAPAKAPEALACGDAVVDATLSPEAAKALGVGGCARLGIELGIPWLRAGATPTTVTVAKKDARFLATIQLRDREFQGSGDTPISAIASAADKAGENSGVVASKDEMRAWGVDKSEHAERARHAFQRFELGLPLLDSDSKDPPDSAFYRLILVANARAGSSARTRALEAGFAALPRLPEARRLAVEANLTFYRDEQLPSRPHALELSRKARDLAPDDPEVASLHASLLLLAGNRDEGFAELDRLVKEHPTHAVRSLRIATGSTSDRDLARSRRYLDDLIEILPESRASTASVELLVLEGRADEARRAIAFGNELGTSGGNGAWLELVTLAPEAARQLASDRLASQNLGVSGDAGFLMVASYALEGRIAEAQSLEIRELERLKEKSPLLAAFHAYHDLRLRRWLGAPRAPQATLDLLDRVQQNEIQLGASRRVRLWSELALARSSKKDDLQKSLEDIERFAKEHSGGDPVELQSAAVGTIPLLRAVRGDRKAADCFIDSPRADFEARRRVALDAALALDAVGERDRAIEAYRLAMDPIDLQSEALGAMIARRKLSKLAGDGKAATELEKLWAKADRGVLGAVDHLR